MKTGFLLGAGFSKGLHPAMPIMSELVAKLDVPEFLPESVQTDIEQTLSYLWTNYPWNSERNHYRNRHHFISLLEQIHHAIVSAEYRAWSSIVDGRNDSLVGPPVYPVQAMALGWRHYNQMIWQAGFAGLLCNTNEYSMVTTNYDTLFERLAIMNRSIQLLYPPPLQRLSGAWDQTVPIQLTNSLGLPYQSSFVGQIPTEINLYKLHGSVSWYALDILEPNTPVYSNDMTREYAVSPDGDRMLAHALSAVIVPPVADKTSLYSNKVLRAQWIGALNSLTECEHLYCVGYSLPVSDLPMKMFLSEACRNIRTAVIVNIREDEDLLTRYKSVLPSNCDITWRTGMDCVKNVAIELLQPAYPHTEFI